MNPHLRSKAKKSFKEGGVVDVPRDRSSRVLNAGVPFDVGKSDNFLTLRRIQRVDDQTF